MATKLAVVVCAVITVSAQGPFTPARYSAGPLPPVQVQAVGGGEVLLEVTVTTAGAVAAVTPLRVTPPFDVALTAAVKGWQFRAADQEDAASPAGAKPRRPVESRVLVAGIFRPPGLLNTPTLGAVPKAVAQGSDEIPQPVATVTPIHPAGALFDGVVPIEVEINAAGQPTASRIVGSGGAFDAPALDAARRWTFRAARRQGRPVPAFAYLVFGFRQPVIVGPRK